MFNQVTIEPQLKTLLFDYLHYIVWGAPVYFLYLALRSYSEGLSHTMPSMAISVLALVINIPLNYIFIYGKFGAPALGGAGCGVATALVYLVMFLATLIYSMYAKPLKKAFLFHQFYWPIKAEIKKLLSIGFPIALSLLFEVSLFMAVALFLAPLGAEVVASHQIAINFSGLVFMIPLSLGMAVTIQVGYALGDNKVQQAKDICTYSIMLGLVIAIFTALITLTFRSEIASIYTEDTGLITMAASLMLLASMFQFSDSIQVISAGALRGYQDTKAILYITFISYWLIGLTLGAILGITDIIVPRMGAAGFWIGFIVGLSTAAVMLTVRLRKVQKRFNHNNFANTAELK